MNDTTKLCKLLLRVLHQLTTCTSGVRTKELTEAGYLLNDLGWPEDITEKLNRGGYEWDDRLDLRGFTK